MPPSTAPQTRIPKRPLANTLLLLALWVVFYASFTLFGPGPARRRRLGPRRGRARDAAAPRLGHALRQRHSLPGEGAAALLVDGRQLQALRSQRSRGPHSARADCSRPRLRGGEHSRGAPFAAPAPASTPRSSCSPASDFSSSPASPFPTRCSASGSPSPCSASG